MKTIDYPRILPQDVFVWHAVPPELNHHVLLPPDGYADTLAELERLPQLPSKMKQQIALHTDWQSVSERRTTGCAFIDQAASYIHAVGIIDGGTLASKCGVTQVEVTGAFKTLTGLSVRDWSSQYTRLMIADLQKRTSLSLEQIAGELHFPSTHAMAVFINYRGKKRINKP